MTADLATDWAPGATPGARPFENEVGDLGVVGVHYAPAQLDFLEVASRFRPGWWQKLYALTLTRMSDPTVPHAEAFGLPALTLDDDMVFSPVIVPSVVEIDCSEWETFDETEPAWRRFPSVLGRPHTYSLNFGTALDSLQPIRLWNVWPLEEADVDLVHDALLTWIKQEWKPWLQWLEVRDNSDTTACDYEGTPVHLHDHEYDEHGYLRSCLNGDHWFQHYGDTEVITTEEHEVYHRPFGAVGGLHHLTGAWTRLLASSMSNTHAGLAAYPDWELDEVARTERHYSPWLWSF